MKKIHWPALLTLVAVVAADAVMRWRQVPVPPTLIAPAAGLIMALFPSVSPALADTIAGVLGRGDAVVRCAVATIAFAAIGTVYACAAGAGLPTQTDFAFYQTEQLLCTAETDARAPDDVCRAQSEARFCARFPTLAICVDGGAP